MLGQLAQMPVETYTETAELFHARRQYHPAFINLSPERLAKLQALFPIEYCVYAAHELQHDSDATNGEARNAILRWLGGQSLAHVCETAELLRRVLAIIGHYHAQRTDTAARNATPAGIDADIAAMRTQSADMPIIGEFAANNRHLVDYINALKAYFSAVVRKSQAEHHVQSIFRARQVSFHDVRRMSITLGRTQFRAARENTRNIDNAAFLDVAELFENDSELTMAINAKHAEAAKPQRYAGTAVKIENAITFDPPLPIPADIAADIQATLDATMPLAQPLTQPPIAAPAPTAGTPTLKIRLFK
jgi:hypothetical protein